MPFSRLPRFPVLLTLIIMIGFVAASTSIWLGLVLFLLLVVLPLTYITFVYYLGTALAIRGQLRAAIAHYSRVLNLPVNRVLIYTRRAALRHAVGDVDGAIADYSAAIQHSHRKDPALYGIRGALYLGKHDYEHALEDSDHLLELHPNSEVGYANRAAAKMFLGDVTGAIADCTAGLEQTNSDSGAALLYNNRGTAHRLAGEYTDAMANYNLAMSRNISQHEKQMIHPAIATNQGILYYLQGDYDNARVYFQQASHINPAFHKARVSLAAARYKLGQLAAAQRLWLDVIKQEPRYDDAAYLQRDLNLPVEMMGDVTDLIESITV